ncbi:Resolvase [Candidatus Burkholderia pumila]|uniref:Resolvase n=1 Tax=Candidatus Burkholderia pumila TaxID=1090375 RepID=A0ABR5HKQ3_9BURK|nr:Resolvase [Candidatus Burkholderia pumila]
MPGVVDLSELAGEAKGVAKIVLKSVQEMLLKLALQIVRGTTRTAANARGRASSLHGRPASTKTKEGHTLKTARPMRGSSRCAEPASITKTADLAACSVSQVKRVWAMREADAE